MPQFFFSFYVTSIVPCCLKENSVPVIQVRHFSFDGMYMLTCHQDGQFLLGCKIIAQILFIDRNLTANQGTALSPSTVPLQLRRVATIMGTIMAIVFLPDELWDEAEAGQVI